MRTPMGTVETARHFKGASFSVEFTPPKIHTRENHGKKTLKLIQQLRVELSERATPSEREY